MARRKVSDGVLDDRDIDLVTEEKKQIIRESQALEFYAVHETPADVGGLGVLKEWLRMRERAFTQEARNYGLPSPKGIALIGIPGTGKSLTAKMIGGLWRLPLLRLDVGALFGSLVGELEERTQRALQLAQTVAPCILWIDELEKAFSKVLSALKAGQLEVVTQGVAEIVEPLLQAFSDADSEIASHASQCALALTNPDTVEVLLQELLEDKTARTINSGDAATPKIRDTNST